MFTVRRIEDLPSINHGAVKLAADDLGVESFGLQVLEAYATPLRPDVSSGVAVWAHIGGFVAGMLLIKLFENPRLVRERNTIREQRQWATANG